MREPMLLINREAMIERRLEYLRRMRASVNFCLRCAREARTAELAELFRHNAEFYKSCWRYVLAELRQLPAFSDCR